MLSERALTLVGAALRAFFAAITLIRRPRPIHPRGVELHGTVTWAGGSQSGIRWIDDAETVPQRVIARASRSIGFPAPVPDIIGLALRFETEDGPADIELASTGVGVPGRFVLRLHGSPSRAHLGTLLPYVGAHGPVLLAARTISPTDLPAELPALARRLAGEPDPEPAAEADGEPGEPWRLRLYVAVPRGRWHPFAELELRAAPGGGDTALRFDAGRHPLPGARMPRWVQAVRQPSYDAVQRPAPGSEPVTTSGETGSPR